MKIDHIAILSLVIAGLSLVPAATLQHKGRVRHWVSVFFLGVSGLGCVAFAVCFCVSVYQTWPTPEEQAASEARRIARLSAQRARDAEFERDYEVTYRPSLTGLLLNGRLFQPIVKPRVQERHHHQD